MVTVEPIRRRGWRDRPHGNASMGLRESPSPSPQTPRDRCTSRLTRNAMEQRSRQRSIGPDRREGLRGSKLVRVASAVTRRRLDVTGAVTARDGSALGSSSLCVMERWHIACSIPRLPNRRNDAATMDGPARLVSRPHRMQSEEPGSARPTDVTGHARGSGARCPGARSTRRARRQHSAGNTGGSAHGRTCRVTRARRARARRARRARRG
jgi:hypothetical protein